MLTGRAGAAARRRRRPAGPRPRCRASCAGRRTSGPASAAAFIRPSFSEAGSSGRHEHRAGVAAGGLGQPADAGHHDGQAPAHRDVQDAAARRAAVGQHDHVRVREGRADDLVGHVLVDEGDPVRVRAGGDERGRLGAALPGLADHGEPQPLGLFPGQRVEDAEQVFQSLVGPDKAEEEQVDHAVLRAPTRTAEIGAGDGRVRRSGDVAVLVVGAVRDQRDAHVHRPVARLEQLPVGLGVDDAAVREPQQRRSPQCRSCGRARSRPRPGSCSSCSSMTTRMPEHAGRDGEQQVGVQRGRGPPLEQQHLGAPARAGTAAPAAASCPATSQFRRRREMSRAVLHARPLEADPAFARVKQAGQQAAEQDDAGIAVVVGHGISQAAGVVADTGGEPPARARRGRRTAGQRRLPRSAAGRGRCDRELSQPTRQTSNSESRKLGSVCATLVDSNDGG